MLHQAVVSNVQGNDKVLKLSDSIESYIQDAVKNFLVLMKSTRYEEIISESIKSQAEEDITLGAGLYLNMNNLLLTLHIPQQPALPRIHIVIIV